MQKVTSYLSLFTSAGTLLCCALPAAFVMLGLGASLAGLVTNVPGLIWLSEHKELTFGLGAVLLLIAGIGHWRGRYAACPIDKEKAKACIDSKRIGFRVFLFSLAIYFVGFVFAFVIPWFMAG